MRISRIEIKNFRGIREANIPLSEHVCAIGPNNSGKSSFLISLKLFLSGNKLSSSDYYNSRDDVVFKVWLEGVNEDLLKQLAEEHRERIRDVVYDEKIILVRRYDTTGKASLNCIRKMPKEKRFRDGEIEGTMSGKRGVELREAIIEDFPELKEKSKGISTQKDFKALIKELVKQIPEDQLEGVERPLPTGIDQSVATLLPEAIYIPAVKDFTDDIKTKETTSFGKILSVVLELISETEQLKDVKESFVKLKTLLNKEVSDDGEIVDKRLPQIKEVESVVGRLLADQFPYAKLDFEIPPPELKTVFSGARIFVNDGIRDTIETKGDGMKRAVTFALLRAYVEIKQRQEAKGNDSFKDVLGRSYLLLFEEPELYLHPKAQRTLYEALGEIAKDHQVCVSTHSPYFLGPESTETFIRFRKKESDVGEPPFSQISPIDLHNDISKRDAFQILCYENNNAAFFCDQVVLCEGDSDLIYLKHISKTISTDWDFDKKNIGLIQVGGKGNIARYREFFGCFVVSVQVISDLDAIINQFVGLGASTECDELRSKLLQDIDKIIDKEGMLDITTIRAKAIIENKKLNLRDERTKELLNKIINGGDLTDDGSEEFEKRIVKERNSYRHKVLSERLEFQDAKNSLLAKLRNEGIHILQKGAIENYYPEGVTGPDKPTRALNACKMIKTRNDVFSLCETVPYGENTVPELEAVFKSIFMVCPEHFNSIL